MNNINKGLKLMRNLKIRKLLHSLNIYLFGNFFLYQRWLRKNLNQPSFSFDFKEKVMIYISDTHPKLLNKTLVSIKKQSYSNYEYKVLHPCQINDVLYETNYCMFIESGDLLTENCLNQLMYLIKDNDAIYADHDINHRWIKSEPKFKPDFSIDLLRSYPYIHHAVLFKTNVLKTSSYQNLDCFIYEQLLYLYETKKTIGHVQHILFHFSREILITHNLVSILKKHYDDLNIEAVITQSSYYIQTQYVNKKGKASIIIPNKDHYEDLKKCMDSIFKYTPSALFEIIIVENNSETKEIFDYYEQLKQYTNITIVYWKDIFNYSAINNYGVSFAKNEYLLFLNNDIEILHHGWLEAMLGACSRKDIGIVGVKLIYSERKVQHGGVVVGTWGLAAHMFLAQDEHYQGYMYRAAVKQNLSAVTAACMMTKRSVFEEVGKFEEQLEVAFNDIDYCLKVSTSNYLVLFDPDIILIHHESLSRGSDEISPVKKARFDSEVAFMNKKWQAFIEKGDPYYNKHLTLDRTDYMLK